MATNRKAVQDGLKRRRLENELDAFEDAMIRRCNDNCASAHLQRKMDAGVRACDNRHKANISARAEAKDREQRKRKDSALNCLTFFFYAVLMFWLTSWTYLPMWAASMYVVFGALFLLLRLCEIHGLLQRKGEK